MFIFVRDSAEISMTNGVNSVMKIHGHHHMFAPIRFADHTVRRLIFE